MQQSVISIRFGLLLYSRMCCDRSDRTLVHVLRVRACFANDRIDPARRIASPAVFAFIPPQSITKSRQLIHAIVHTPTRISVIHIMYSFETYCAYYVCFLNAGRAFDDRGSPTLPLPPKLHTTERFSIVFFLINNIFFQSS